jgi:type VI secretion system protein ImpI
MAYGLNLRVSGGTVAFERAFQRIPVAIGRDAAAHCILRDEKVSKVHAWLDVQQGSIYVRDVGSTNGTFVAAERIEKNRWYPIGTASKPGVFEVAGFKIEVSVYDPGERSCATLAESLLDDGAFPSRPVPAGKTRIADVEEENHGHTYKMGGPIARLAAPYSTVVKATEAFGAAMDRELAEAPPTARGLICEQIVATYPDLATDPRLRALLRQRGWAGAPADGAGQGPLAAAALDALQDLASWYVGRQRILMNAEAVGAFKDNLRATLDEFILGYVPLLAGLGTFEQQMAIQPARAQLPTSPATLAEKLLDWQQDAAGIRERLRTSFSELMMHQVALLNGVMSGVKALLTELAPSTIERAAEKENGRLTGLASLFSKLEPWAVYKRRHGDLADEENERFRLLFGREFVDEYRQFTREAQAGGQKPQANLFATAPKVRSGH